MTESKTRVASLRRVFSDQRLVLLVIIVAALVGGAYLLTWTGKLGPDRYSIDYTWFAPSAMWAAGNGFVVPDVSKAPELLAFLDQREAEIDWDRIPEDLPTSEPFQWHLEHYYLTRVVGLTWWLCGLSWNAVKIPLIVLFCATGAAAYGIFRLGMNRLFSAVAAIAFLLMPAMLAQLPSIRDFCKAPFLLGAVFLMGYVIKKRVTGRALCGLAALLGLTIGFGVGFREDLFVMAFPAPLIVAFASRGKPRLSLGHRMAAVTLLAVGFVIPAWPALKASSHTTFQEIILGLSTAYEDDLGLGRASYERLYNVSDPFAFATASSYGERVLGWPGPEAYYGVRSEQAGRRFYLDVVRTFPGDMIARGYGAVLRILRDPRVRLGPYPRPRNAVMDKALALHVPLATHFARFGLFYAAAALVVLSVRSPRLAWLTLLGLLYVCSYVNLKFELRHCFHLGFVPLWCLGLLADQVGLALWGLRQRERRHRVARALAAPGRWWAPPVRRVGYGVAAAALLLLAPLYGARAVQHHQVGALVQRYGSARLEPLETERVQLEHRVLFRLREPLIAPDSRPHNQQMAFKAGYLALALAPNADPLPVELAYETGPGAAGFPGTIETGPAGAPETGETRCFFPVYESFAPNIRYLFEGVALPAGQAQAFRGLYRVRNIDDFPLLLTFVLPADRSRFRNHKTLPWEADVQARSAANLEQAGFAAGAIDLYRVACALRPSDPLLHAALGEALCRAGDFRGALGPFRTALEQDPTLDRVRPQLAVALYRTQALDAARQEAQRCRELRIPLPPDFPEELLGDPDGPR